MTAEQIQINFDKKRQAGLWKHMWEVKRMFKIETSVGIGDRPHAALAWLTGSVYAADRMSRYEIREVSYKIMQIPDLDES